MLQKESKKYREYVRSLPPYLSAFAEPQNYDQYTSEDQAVWRFIMRQLTEFFKDKAPEAYFKGLEKARIPVDRIPKIEEMIGKQARHRIARHWSALVSANETIGLTKGETYENA